MIRPELILIILLGFMKMEAQCKSVSIHENYSIRRTLEDESKLDDPEFINDLKQQLINQISTFVDSSVNIKSSNKKKKKIKSRKITERNSSIASLGILNDPTIYYCNKVVTMSINKEEYKKNQYDYFTIKLETYADSLNNLLSIGNIDDVKFLKDMISSYGNKISEISSLLPLVSLKDKEKKILHEFTSNYNLLLTKEASIRYQRRENLNGRLKTLKKGFNRLVDVIAPIQE